MKTMTMSRQDVKFPVKSRPEFINELRKKVKEHFKAANTTRFGNGSLVFKGIFMLLVYFIPYGLILSGQLTSLPIFLLAWVIMGVAVAGLGMGLMHDANHGSFSSNPKVNKWLGKSLYLLGGFPPNWRYQHNTMHHGYTNIDGHDEDIAPVGILRFSPHKPLKKIHRFQQFYAWFFYGLMTFSWVTMKDFKQLRRYKQEEVALSNKNNFKLLFVDLVFSKIVYYGLFLALPIILVPLPWYLTVAGFLTMHFVAGLTLGSIFQTAHVVPTSEYPLPDDEGNIENNWAIHQLLTTSDFAPKSRIFSWYVGGLNYQVVHHLFPHVSHVHYRKMAKLVQETAEKYNLPYHVQGNFFTALRNHFIMLKQLGTKPASI